MEDKRIVKNKAWDDQTHVVGMGNFLIKFYDTETPYLQAKAATMDSDFPDAKKYVDDQGWTKGKTRRDPEYSSPRLHLPSQIDLAPWYLDMLRGTNWPNFDQDLIGMCMQDDYMRRFLEGGTVRTPVDALQTFSHTMIHEVSPSSSRNFHSFGNIFRSRLFFLVNTHQSGRMSG
jgi:hypothetical protein